jgi:hypothetical protein
MSGKHEVMLFTKCTGLNDSLETSAAAFNVDGVTDVIGCLNVTVTPEGKLVKVPELTEILTHTDVIDELTAGTRMLAQSASGLSEFNGTNFTPLLNSPSFTPGVKATYIHTPIDVRIRTAPAVQHKLVKGAVSTSAITLGSYAGPATSRSSAFSKMPDFTSGFVFNSRLYAAFGNFLQYSEEYYYDLWHLGDGHIGSKNAVLQSGQIPGCVITIHSDGVTGYFGTGPEDFQRKFFPCSVISGTLFSGFLSKVYDSAHVFMCTDGVYILTADGKLVNLTVANTDHLDILNTSYSAVTVVDGKYLAFGNLCCIEYDFQVRALLLRSTFDIKSTCLWNNKQYYGSGKKLLAYGVKQDTTMPASVRLPFNDFGDQRNKQIRVLYFTGKITGSASVVVRNQYGNSITRDVSNIGYVQNYRLSGLRSCKGQKLSVEFIVKHGEFKLEELRATFVVRSR